MGNTTHHTAFTDILGMSSLCSAGNNGMRTLHLLPIEKLPWGADEAETTKEEMARIHRAHNGAIVKFGAQVIDAFDHLESIIGEGFHNFGIGQVDWEVGSN